MDGISLLEASLLYSVLFIPLLSMISLLFWTSTNMKNTAKAQLLGISLLVILGLLAINSPFILIIEAIAVILFIIWIFAYRDVFLKGQLTVVLLIFALQVSYFFILFIVFIEVGFVLSLVLLCIVPILSMILLYPWVFGTYKTSNGRAFIIFVFIVQVIFVILNIVLLLNITSNL